ncbi:MAG: hypothetical protein QM808_00050 [Steroidobacteraceae bacterium]
MFKLFDDEPTPAPTRTQREAPGQVRFDDRGNAIYEWAEAKKPGQKSGYQGEEPSWERALLNPTLALVDDQPPTGSEAIRNFKGLRLGYNPYESGQLCGKRYAKKRDMNKLSEWIATKQRLEVQNNPNGVARKKIIGR